MRSRLFAAVAIVGIAAVPAAMATGESAGPGGQAAARGGSPPPIVPVLNKQVFFTANGPDDSGYELWRSNGTKPGTKLVKNILPGPDDSYPAGFMRLGKRLLFAAERPDQNRELWRTNGTAQGTKLVKDIYPGTDSGSDPRYLVRFGDIVVFNADDGTHGAELWRTDGTRAGTRMVKNINAGNDSSYPVGFARLGKRVYFGARDATHGVELWRTDGTRKGTKLVKNIAPGANDSFPDSLTKLGKRLYFRASDDDGIDVETGPELWRTNGTAAGTRLVKDLNPGAGGSNPFDFTRLGNRLLFNAITDVGYELFRTDGTRAGTKLLKNIADAEPASSYPTDLTRLGNRILFRAETPEFGTELWRSDGTGPGTRLVKDINPGDDDGNPGPDHSFPCRLARLGDEILFGAIAGPGGAGAELWRSDGTTAGTKLLKNIVPGPSGSDPGGCD